MNKIYSSALLLFLLFLIPSTNAQGIFDIGLFQKPGFPNILEVRLKANQTVSGLVSNLAFTISWDGSTGTDLSASLVFPYPLVITPKAGGETTNLGLEYQKFVGFNNITSFWTAGSEVAILEIPVISLTNPANPLPINNFKISTDAYTVSINAEFYVEFNSLPRTGIIYNSSPIFPVELMGFTAEKVDEQKVMLNWATASEQNNSFFLIEKKLESGLFNEIGKIKSQGDSDEIQSYSFLDGTRMGATNTYRLKQVDHDGKFSYSPSVEIRFQPGESKLFRVYPSPAQNVAYIQAHSPLDGPYRFYVSDMAGKVVLSGVIDEDSPTYSATLILGGIARGTYMVRTESPLGQVYINRLVKR